MKKMTEQLKKQGFTQDQINEIEEGRKAGLDVSLYAKKEFLAIQMRQIRFGMQQGVAVEKYAKCEYDWFQMEEIRKGLVGGVEVEKYASPDISYDRMYQIRWGLCAGIDLSPYKKMDAGILKELRLAVQNRINLITYINEGYDAEQLEAIRIALEKDLDIVPYLKKEYRGISIQEISEGLEKGLDVSIYARIDYSWQQMREIRLGLEHMVDVKQYSSPFFLWQQMREIRLGLEEGLDVSSYRKYIYMADEMRERRSALQKNHGITFVKEETAKVEEDALERCQVTISSDEMKAYLEVEKGVTDLCRTDVLKALRSKGILYGIQYDKIDEAVRKKQFCNPILVAEGQPVIDGQDGWYEFFFRTEVARTPKILEQGNVDYRSIEWFETVEEAQKLAYYHKATSGKNGIAVTGETVFAKRGREQSILTGKGFKRLSDGRTYISSKQGIVTIQDNYLEVSNLLVMDEVNLATGDVDFEGSVCIRGDVSSSTKIKATGDVLVNGYVEASEIVCGGNALLQQGMNASGNGFLRAGKDILGQFFESVEISAGGNIQANYFLNCRIYTKENIKVTGNKGVLAGGSVFAEKGLHTYNLGNPAGIATYVKLGIGEQIMKKEKCIEEAIRNAKSELVVLNNAHHDFQRKYAPEVRNSMEIYLKIESAIYTKEKEVENLLREKSELADEKKKSEFVSAVIENELYEGVTLEIDGLRWCSKNVKGIVVKKKNNRIAMFSK